MQDFKVRITTPFYEESVQFYVECLGMKVQQSWDEENDKGCLLVLNRADQGSAVLELAYQQEYSSFSGMSLQFKVDNLTDVITQFSSKVVFKGPVKRPWGSEYLYLKDPSGIQIVVYAEI